MSLVSRRSFIAMAASSLMGLQQSADKSALIVRSKRPEDLEMPLAGFADFITPVESFFVRTHVAVPTVDVNMWRLKVDGQVSTPLTLSLDDLRQMPSVELVAVLECAGNGRSFYEPPVAGLQWANGAVGNGRWRGVRLRDLLERAGLKTSAAEVLFDGADVPIGMMADFQRSIPVAKALDPATLLAYEMNGASLPVKHGFPLRAVVSGWAGDSWTKWVTNVRVLAEPFTGFWMKNAYLHPPYPVPPGTVVPASEMIPVTSLRVKSVIGSPAPDSRLDAGKAVVVRGVAWTGDGGTISAVEVSTDRGRSWNAARLVGAAGRFSWRQWEFGWTPKLEAHHTLLARARDSSGNVQPIVQEWNPSGYLWNVVARTDVQVGRTSGTPSTAETPSPIVESDNLRSCLLCHDADVIRQQRLTRAQWEREIDKMTNWGARVPADQRQMLIDYLVRIAGPSR